MYINWFFELSISMYKNCSAVSWENCKQTPINCREGSINWVEESGWTERELHG